MTKASAILTLVLLQFIIILALATRLGELMEGYIR